MARWYTWNHAWSIGDLDAHVVRDRFADPLAMVLRLDCLAIAKKPCPVAGGTFHVRTPGT